MMFPVLDHSNNVPPPHSSKNVPPPQLPQLFLPPIVPKPEVQPAPVPEVQPAPVPEVQPAPVPEVQPEPAAEVLPEPAVEVQPEPVPEVQPAPVPEVQPEPAAEVQPEPVPEVQPEPASEEVQPEICWDIEELKYNDTVNALVSQLMNIPRNRNMVLTSTLVEPIDVYMSYVERVRPYLVNIYLSTEGHERADVNDWLDRCQDYVCVKSADMCITLQSKKVSLGFNEGFLTVWDGGRPRPDLLIPGRTLVVATPQFMTDTVKTLLLSINGDWGIVCDTYMEADGIGVLDGVANVSAGFRDNDPDSAYFNSDEKSDSDSSSTEEEDEEDEEEELLDDTAAEMADPHTTCDDIARERGCLPEWRLYKAKNRREEDDAYELWDDFLSSRIRGRICKNFMTCLLAVALPVMGFVAGVWMEASSHGCTFRPLT